MVRSGASDTRDEQCARDHRHAVWEGRGRAPFPPADLLWRPLPKGWEMGATPAPQEAGSLMIPDHVLEHRAVLSTPDGEPFSEVVETYTSEVLAFPPPR